MLVRDLFEYDAWHGPDDQWHSASTDPWSNGNDEWHGQASGNMMEEDTGAEMADIVTAKDLISQALRDPEAERHNYFEFLKFLRKKYGEQYSTLVHQAASKLVSKKV